MNTRLLQRPSYEVLCLDVQSCPTLCYLMDCSPPGSSVHGDSSGKNTRMGCHALLKGIFPTQGLNPGLLHCKGILYHLSHKGSPRMLEWVAYPSPADLPVPGIKPGSPALQVDSLPTELCPVSLPTFISKSLLRHSYSREILDISFFEV